MSSLDTSQSLFSKWTGWMQNSLDYWVDTTQRSILFFDILRKRGNNYFEQLEKGLPPVLIFDYEMIIDGRTLDRPVNYALVHIINRRKDNNPDTRGYAVNRRQQRSKKIERNIYPEARPIVVIDPRAGNGPGIGGSKRDSEIGDALDQGHPVYFFLFYPEPVPGQTLADVQNAEVHFIEEVAKRHPEAEKPAVIGNCQAGWAVALIGAERPDLTGPMVLNGAPLSYWSGVRGKNPMRYTGGLIGGVWVNSFLSDIGNGKFDGANLVSNFEQLNPANTYWKKQYHVYANVDNEEERYLNFEKWWNGFSFMNSEEIHTIVQDLFVGNKLEQGRLSLKKEKLNLEDIKEPVVLFASKGDNITPPQQALDWIVKTYGSLDEIKYRGHVIVYMLHKEIGHLGIFVSGRVAKKEHREIIKNIDMIEYLPPGLYEMIIDETNKKEGVSDYRVRFEERNLSDIMKLNDNMEDIKEDAEEFRRVAAISEINDKFYQMFISPWVRMWVTELSAETFKQLHPLRIRAYSFSDRNPFLLPIKNLAPVIKKNRRPVSSDNPFLTMEKAISETIVTMLNFYRDMRDDTSEFLFRSIYENPWLDLAVTTQTDNQSGKMKKTDKQEQPKIRREKCRWPELMDKGGFAEGIIRIMVAMTSADTVFQRSEFDACKDIIKSNKKLQYIKPEDFKRMVKEQSCILETDEYKALKALQHLIPSSKDRKEALKIAMKIAFADREVAPKEKVILDKIKKALF